MRVGFIAVALLYFIPYSSAYAGPWFTGPLLAPAGKTIPKGHVNFELYGFETENIGIFNRHWRLVHTFASTSRQINPLFTYGLAERADVQVSLPYVINKAAGQSGRHIGDTSIVLGYQVFKDDESFWHPHFRFTLQESFPTGRFQELNPANEGTDGTGSGSYQTIFGLNFQHLTEFNDINYLRTRLVLTYLYPSPVAIRGHSTYGGNAMTHGTVKPGNLWGIDLAGEFSVTRHWAAVMEGYYFYRGNTSFTGNPGQATQGVLPTIGHPTAEEISLAPAIEYNFNEHYGIIGGAWFAVRGKSAADFISTVVAFNAYW